MKIERPKVDALEISLVLEQLSRGMAARLKKHGYGAYVGPHEALGVITEEYAELVEAARRSDRPGDATEFADELLDVAVAALFGIASLRTTGRIPRLETRVHVPPTRREPSRPPGPPSPPRPDRRVEIG